MLICCTEQNGETKLQVPIGHISLVFHGESVWALAIIELADLIYFSFLLTAINWTKHIWCNSCTFLALKSNNSKKTFFFLHNLLLNSQHKVRNRTVTYSLAYIRHNTEMMLLLPNYVCIYNECCFSLSQWGHTSFGWIHGDSPCNFISLAGDQISDKNQSFSPKHRTWKQLDSVRKSPPSSVSCTWEVSKGKCLEYSSTKESKAHAIYSLSPLQLKALGLPHQCVFGVSIPLYFPIFIINSLYIFLLFDTEPTPSVCLTPSSY